MFLSSPLLLLAICFGFATSLPNPNDSPKALSFRSFLGFIGVIPSTPEVKPCCNVQTRAFEDIIPAEADELGLQLELVFIMTMINFFVKERKGSWKLRTYSDTQNDSIYRIYSIIGNMGGYGFRSVKEINADIEAGRQDMILAWQKLSLRAIPVSMAPVIGAYFVGVFYKWESGSSRDDWIGRARLLGLYDRFWVPSKLLFDQYIQDRTIEYDYDFPPSFFPFNNDNKRFYSKHYLANRPESE